MPKHSVRLEKVTEIMDHISDPDYPFAEEIECLSFMELALVCERERQRANHCEPSFERHVTLSGSAEADQSEHRMPIPHAS